MLSQAFEICFLGGPFIEVLQLCICFFRVEGLLACGDARSRNFTARLITLVIDLVLKNEYHNRDKLELSIMKPGRLFENALKQAHIDLKPGTEIQVKVRGKGNSLHLVVGPSGISEFEASILERSQRAVEDLKPYDPKMPVGERIRTLRKTAGLTLEAVASKADMTKGSLCSIEKGERPCGLAVVRKIAKALRISVTALIE